MSTFKYRRWRHGGWYVDNVRYPSGAVGCVSRNYPDKQWRIVCAPMGKTYRTRDEAAQAEKDMIAAGAVITPQPARVNIGDVLVHVGVPPRGNPYSTPSLIGDERVAALRRYRDRQPTPEYTFWHVPRHGGAHIIEDPAQVDWAPLNYRDRKEGLTRA